MRLDSLSLRTKFIAGFIPMFVISFAVFFAISYYMSSQALFRDSDKLSQEIGVSTALKIANVYQQKELVIEGLANNRGIIAGDREQRIKILAETKASHDGFAMLAYADVNGQAVSDDGKDMDRSSRDYIKAVRETKKPYMTGASISGTSGKLITIMAYPVLENGELTGIIYGTIALDDITEIVGNIKYMDTGRVYVADQEGLCIAYAQAPEDVGQLDLSKKNPIRRLIKRW